MYRSELLYRVTLSVCLSVCLIRLDRSIPFNNIKYDEMKMVDFKLRQNRDRLRRPGIEKTKWLEDEFSSFF